MTKEDIQRLEEELRSRGLSSSVRTAIRNAKIAVVDDHIEDLKGVLDGLRAEGFNNLVEMRTLSSVNALLEADFDLVILDLVGIAPSISAYDGVGVIAALKKANPALPVLVVSGNTITPNVARLLNEADLIRSKPVLPVELAHDVSELLCIRKDEHWAGVAVLNEVHRLQPEIRERLNWQQKLLLGWHINRLAKQIAANSPNVVMRLVKITDIVTKLGAIALRAVKLGTGFNS